MFLPHVIGTQGTYLGAHISLPVHTCHTAPTWVHPEQAVGMPCAPTWLMGR